MLCNLLTLSGYYMYSTTSFMIFILTAIGCIPGGSGTRLLTKITYNNYSQHQQYIEQTIYPPLGGGEIADRAPSLRGIP